MSKTWLDEFYELNPTSIDDAPAEKKKEHKLDLFKVVLPALDRRNKKFYENSTPEEQKELAKLVWPVTRWMSSTKGNAEHHLMMVNDVVNKNSGDLKKHPQLQWQLLAVCGIGKPQFHQWVAPPKGIKKNRLEEAILKIKPLLKDDDLELLIKINDEEELKLFFRDNAYSDKEIKEII